MAAELTKTGQRISLGNRAAWAGYLTNSGLTGGAAMLLGYIEGGIVTVRSASGIDSFTVAYNYGSGATAINGSILLTSGIASTVYDCLVWGKP
jgi:hypothetical protein